MMRGRIGGGGAPFNLGEATVTRATVRLGNGAVGSRLRPRTVRARRSDSRRSLTRCGRSRPHRQAVEDTILAPIAQRLNDNLEDRRAETAATKVDFFTMVRGDD